MRLVDTFSNQFGYFSGNCQYILFILNTWCNCFSLLLWAEYTGSWLWLIMSKKCHLLTSISLFIFIFELMISSYLAFVWCAALHLTNNVTSNSAYDFLSMYNFIHNGVHFLNVSLYKYTLSYMRNLSLGPERWLTQWLRWLTALAGTQVCLSLNKYHNCPVYLFFSFKIVDLF